MHGWLELLMEGYRDLFQGVGRLLREGDGSIERNHLRVATGSARIAIYDAVPLTLRLIERLGASEGVVLDYGCGNALYLIALCAQHPGLRALGVELAQETVRQRGRTCAKRGWRSASRSSTPRRPTTCPPRRWTSWSRRSCCTRSSASAGWRARSSSCAPSARASPSALLIVEVSNPYEEGRGELVGSDRQGRGYYNYYIWLHSVTTQRLLPHAQWLELFARPATASCTKSAWTTSSTPRASRSDTRWSVYRASIWYRQRGVMRAETMSARLLFFCVLGAAASPSPSC